MREVSWATRIGKLALIVGIIGAGLLFVGATMVRYAMGGSKMAGFGYIPYGVYFITGAVVLAVVALLWRFFRKNGTGGPALWALIIAGVPAIWLASQIIPARDVPPIHDVTTDLANPPEFSTLTLPEDNLRGVETEEAWRAIHTENYSDIEPVVIAKPVAEVIRDATALADARGWTIAVSAPEEGRLEATETVSYYKFDDDVVLRVTDNGEGVSQVDMRSVSRVGVSDLGYNAQRIRDFLSDLQGS